MADPSSPKCVPAAAEHLHPDCPGHLGLCPSFWLPPNLPLTPLLCTNSQDIPKATPVGAPGPLPLTQHASSHLFTLHVQVEAFRDLPPPSPRQVVQPVPIPSGPNKAAATNTPQRALDDREEERMLLEGAEGSVEGATPDLKQQSRLRAAPGAGGNGIFAEGL